jgi:hypothetical protein
MPPGQPDRSRTQTVVETVRREERPGTNQTNVYGPSLGNVLAILMVRLGVNLEYPRTSSVPPEPRRGPKRRNGRPRSERNRVRD